MDYVQRKFYLPKDVYTQLGMLAQDEGKTITQVLRELVGDGLKQKKKKNSMRQLVELARKVRKEGWQGPRDWSVNHDKYFAQASAKGNGK